MATKKTFENAIVELEEVVSEIENADADLDKSIELFEKGIKLSAFCKEKLDCAEQKIKILVGEDGDNPVFDDFSEKE